MNELDHVDSLEYRIFYRTTNTREVTAIQRRSCEAKNPRSWTPNPTKPIEMCEINRVSKRNLKFQEVFVYINSQSSATPIQFP